MIFSCSEVLYIHFEDLLRVKLVYNSLWTLFIQFKGRFTVRKYQVKSNLWKQDLNQINLTTLVFFTDLTKWPFKTILMFKLKLGARGLM